MARGAADQSAADLRHFSPSCITVSNLKVIRDTAITTGRASLIRKSDDRRSKINNENEKRSR
jgi:hypothetical protein